MQTAATFQEFSDRGAWVCWFDQFYAWISRLAWVDKRYAHTLQGSCQVCDRLFPSAAREELTMTAKMEATTNPACCMRTPD
jgi:hypothetical protein